MTDRAAHWHFSKIKLQFAEGEVSIQTFVAENLFYVLKLMLPFDPIHEFLLVRHQFLDWRKFPTSFGRLFIFMLR